MSAPRTVFFVKLECEKDVEEIVNQVEEEVRESLIENKKVQA